MSAAWSLPLIAFALLAALERFCAPGPQRVPYSRSDHLLNIAGLAIQGLAVPLLGYWIAVYLLAVHWPHAAGALPIGWLGAFLLNFVVVDFLYYWQHRLFHRVPLLWALHQCHHASPSLDVWASARNSLLINFLFVYMLVNPIFGFLCDRPDGFFTAAALTASLDLWRHSRLPQAVTPPSFGRFLVTPAMHHAHHAVNGTAVNYGANLIVWDRLFGTAQAAHGWPRTYGMPHPAAGWRQFLFPW
jgi:sterol desaturase/sphingolipid hydroxylase (fatty acid hydroxylase superfamily)